MTIQQDKNGISPGIYRHYKGKLYFVLGLSRHTETNEVCVVYRPLYETDWPQLVHRPLAMFLEQVTTADGSKARFALLSGGDLSAINSTNAT